LFTGFLVGADALCVFCSQLSFLGEADKAVGLRPSSENPTFGLCWSHRGPSEPAASRLAQG